MLLGLSRVDKAIVSEWPTTRPQPGNYIGVVSVVCRYEQGDIQPRAASHVTHNPVLQPWSSTCSVSLVDLLAYSQCYAMPSLQAGKPAWLCLVCDCGYQFPPQDLHKVSTNVFPAHTKSISPASRWLRVGLIALAGAVLLFAVALRLFFHDPLVFNINSGHDYMLAFAGALFLVVVGIVCACAAAVLHYRAR